MRQINCVSFIFLTVFLACSSQKQQAEPGVKKVDGAVIDRNTNEPIFGALIEIKNTAKGKIERKAFTDFNGNFEIEARKGETLQISYVGFYTERVVIDESNEYKIKLAWNDGSRDKRRQRDLRRLARKNGGSYVLPD